MKTPHFKRDQEFFTALEEVLDQYFPKVEEEGEAKRLMKRSEALMLFAEANLLHSKALARVREKTLVEVEAGLPKVITPTVEPPPNRLSQNQIFAGGQVNMAIRTRELLASMKDTNRKV